MAHKVIRVLSGFNRNAEIVMQRGVPLIIGSQEDCSVVLVDDKVAANHCQVTLTSAGLVCTALDADMAVGGKVVSPGKAVKLADYQLIKCGSVYIAAGDASGDWSALKHLDENELAARCGQSRLGRIFGSASPVKRGLYAGLAMLGVAGCLGIAYAAFSPDRPQMSAAYLDDAKRWLKSVAPAGSELAIAWSQDKRLVLSGYVATNYQNELLNMAANDSPFRPVVEVYAVEQMVTSLSRLANLENLPCIVTYMGGGRLGCNNDIHDGTQAVRLQSLGQQVSGLKALSLRPVTPGASTEHLAIDAAALPVTGAGAMPKPESGPVRDFYRKLHVVMTKKERYVVDSRGLKFHEGDVIDGFTVAAIQLDQIQLERDNHRYLILVAMEQ